MDVKEAIELINNSDDCYSLWDAEELLEDCKFKIRQNFTSNRWNRHKNVRKVYVSYSE